MRHKIQISLLIPEGWTTVAVAAIVTAGWLHIEPPRNLVGVLMMSTLFVAPIGALCAVIGAGYEEAAEAKAEEAPAAE